MKLIRVTIKGTTPLLTQRFNESAEIQSATRKAVVSVKTPREEAEKVTYRDSQGRFYFPGAAFSRLLRESGSNHKMRGTRKSVKYVVPASVLVIEDAILLTNGDGKTLMKDYEVDSRSVVIPSTKGRVMKYRPRFDEWSMTFQIRVNEEILEPDFVHTLLSEGGQQIGLGDFRPAKGGPFGTFQVIEWKEQN